MLQQQANGTDRQTTYHFIDPATHHTQGFAEAVTTRKLGEEMHGVCGRGFKTKRKTKEDLDKGCQRGLSST